MNKVFNIAVIGLGQIGIYLYNELKIKKKEIEKKTGKKYQIVAISAKNKTKKSHNGNRTHSAKTLGISLRTLRNKINEFAVQGYEIPQPTSGRAL